MPTSEELKVRRPLNAEQRVQRREEYIRALEQMQSCGESYTVEKIAKTVGGSVGGFYLYFESLEQLRAELLRRQMADHRPAIDDAGVLSILAEHYLSPEMRKVLEEHAFVGRAERAA